MSLPALHGYLLGFAVIGAWAVIMIWSTALWLLGYSDTPVFWRAVSLAQILLAVQLLVGVVMILLWLLGRGQAPGANSGGGLFNGAFHVLYGIVFPAIALVVGHGIARRGRYNAHMIFAVVGLVIFGLTARAWMLGAGVG
jgi:hypothetical protein